MMIFRHFEWSLIEGRKNPMGICLVVSNALFLVISSIEADDKRMRLSNFQRLENRKISNSVN